MTTTTRQSRGVTAGTQISSRENIASSSRLMGGAAFGAMCVAALAASTGAASAQSMDMGPVRIVNAGGPVNRDIDHDITTDDNNMPGIFVRNNDDVTLTGAPDITTNGDNSNAVDVETSAGNVDLTLGDIETNGELSQGVHVVGGADSNVTINVGDVATGGTTGPDFFFLPSSAGISVGTGGDVDITAGNVSTAGVGADGIVVGSLGEVGNISISAGSVTATGDGASGISAFTYGNDSTIAITTTDTVSGGDGANAIEANAYGGDSRVAINAQDVNATGFNAAAIQAGSGSNGLNIKFRDATTDGTLADGIAAGSTGDISITGRNVTVTGAASTGIDAGSSDGDVEVNTTGTVLASGRGGTGIFASSDTGAVLVNAHDVSTVAANEDDTDAARQAIYATGTSAGVTSDGTITTTGVGEFGGSGDAVTAIGTDGNAAVTVNNVSTGGDGARAVVANATNGDAGVFINGTVTTTGENSDSVVISGDRAGVQIAKGATVTGTGNFITLNSTDGSVVKNYGTLGNAENGSNLVFTGTGAATVDNYGTLAADFRLTDGNDVLNNNGRFFLTQDPDFGDGVDRLLNNGTIMVGPTGNSTLVSLEQFVNQGTINLQNGKAGDTITTPGTYTGGNGALLAIDYAPGATPASDMLVIGGAATGSTAVNVNTIGTGPVFNSGAVIVNAGAGSSANAFGLAPNSRDQGLVRYNINYNPTTNDYSLTAGPSDAAFRTLDFAEGLRNIWTNSADAWSGQMRARRDAQWSYGGGQSTGRFWGQIHGSVDDRDNVRTVSPFGDTRNVNLGYHQDYFGGQFGLDLAGGVSEKGGFAAGITGGYTNSSLQFSRSADTINIDDANVGVYGSFSTGNVFVNALGKYDHYWAGIRSVLGNYHDDLDGSTYGGRVEVGLRAGSDHFFVEPVATISYIHTDLDDFTRNNVNVNFRPDDGLAGKVGARAGGTVHFLGVDATGYIGGNYVHEFEGEDRIAFTSGGQTLSYRNGNIRDYGEGVLGINIGSPDQVSGFIEGNYANGGNFQSAGGRAGIRVRF